MPMGEATFIGVLGEHVPVFNFEGFTDAIRHGRGVRLSASGIAEKFDVETLTISVAFLFTESDEEGVA